MFGDAWGYLGDIWDILGYCGVDRRTADGVDSFEVQLPADGAPGVSAFSCRRSWILTTGTVLFSQREQRHSHG